MATTHENDSLLGGGDTEIGPRNNTSRRESSSSDEWGEEGSSSYSSRSSYSGGSCSEDSYIANWENHVGPDGTLFFAEYSCYNTPPLNQAPRNAINVMKNDFSRASTRRSSKKANKISMFSGKRGKNAATLINSLPSTSESSKVTFSEGTQGEIKEIELIIYPDNRFKFGRRATACESMLGFSTSPFPDGHRLMVAGYMANSELSRDNYIKVGDWFKSLNEHNINAQNIEETLSQFTKPTKVIVTFQRISNEEQITANSNTIHQVISYKEFAESAHNLLTNNNMELNLQKLDNEMIFSLMMLNLEFSEDESDTNDVLFCYPAKESNVLFAARGTYLTLHSILKTELNTDTISTTVSIDGTDYHTCYYCYNKIVILLSISSKYGTLKEVKCFINELVQYFQFSYLTFIVPVSDSVKLELELICKVLEVRMSDLLGIPCFEQLFQESHLVSLPKEGQLRIYDALSEMEAMDYREWNDEPLNSHREFFIYGSVLYFKSYLLANHLPVSQLAGVESFLRLRGVFKFIEQQNVRDLVIWQEIPMMASETRYFLTVVSRNHLMLVVILQSFETDRRITEDGKVQERIMEPSLFYIEEVQETLDHLRHGGIEALARAWVSSNKRPEVATTIKNSQNSNAAPPLPPRRTEVISILKHRSTSSEDVRINSSMGGSSVHSLTHSEDSNQKLDDADSDSDWEGFPDSHKSSSGFDMSEIKGSFLKEVSDIIPSRVTAGKENVLFHYVHLDVGTGMMLSPPEINSSPIIDIFRSSCQLIHTVLQNTKKFRRILSQESTKPNTHKSLVAIKEHGILVSIPNETSIPTSFWVIGRLFTSPTRELYVCHRSDVPQNLVEIAFRLSFLTTG